MNMLTELGSIVLDTHHLGSFTDDEFYNFCLDNRDLKFERDAQSNIIIMSNTGGKTGNFNAEISADVIFWNRKLKSGFCFDSSTAFLLPNTAVRSPDVAWIEKEKWNKLSEVEKIKFPPISPDFVIEIKSHTDNLKTLQDKMKEWLDNGTKLAWLINPEEKLTYVYFDNQIKEVPFDAVLSGESVLNGFEINLKDIFGK